MSDDTTRPPSRLATLWRRASGVLFLELDPFVLGAYRVVLGLVLLLFYVMLAPSWIRYYGPDGICVVPLRSLAEYRLLDSPLSYMRSKTACWVFYGASVLACLLLVWRVLPRLAAAWLWFSMLSLSVRNPYVVNGEEQVFLILLFFSMFLPFHRTFPLSDLLFPARRRQILVREQRVPAWSLTILQVHVVLIYLLSWIHKPLSDVAWRDGTAVYYGMMAMNYPRWPGLDIFAWSNGLVSRTLTYFTLAAEGIAPILMWWRRGRVVCVLTLLGLHVALAILLEGVAMFNVAMIAALVLFLPSRRTRAVLCQAFVNHRGRSWRLWRAYLVGDRGLVTWPGGPVS